MTILTRLWRDEDGQSLVEYGLILGLVSVGLVVALRGLKTPLTNIFNMITGSLKGASSGGAL